MSMPETEREKASQSPFEPNSLNKPEDRFASFDQGLPHFQKLLDMQRGDESKALTRTSFSGANKDSIGDPLSLFLHSKGSPWEKSVSSAADKTVTGPKGEVGPTGEVGPQLAVGPKAEDGSKTEVGSKTEIGPKTEAGAKSESEAKAKDDTEKLPETKSDSPKDDLNLPSLTIDSGRKNAAEVGVSDLSKLKDLLPSFDIDLSQIKSFGNDVLNGLAKLSEQAKEANESKKAPLAVDSPNGSTWKNEGGQWNLYDKSGKKSEKYAGLVSEVSKDADGTAQIKLNDGRTIKEKQDGSTLEYDSQNRLTSINYKNGSSRTFNWEGEQLVGMKSSLGEFVRMRDGSGKPIDEWKQKGQENSAPWKGEMKVDEKVGTLSIGPNTYRSDLSVEKLNADGSREITHANKDLVKVSKDGLVSQIDYADGSSRKFSWTKNPDAKGEDDKFTLSAVQVQRDGKHFYHTRADGDKWNVQSWENGKWSDAKPETTSFSFDNKTKEYSYVDSTDGIKHSIEPGGVQRDVSRDGSTLSYKDGKLSTVTNGDIKREFEWKDNKLESIKDAAQGKVWTRSAEGGWQSDKGDRTKAEASITASGEIEFKSGDKSSIIKMDGSEFSRISNAQDKSQVDIRDGEVQVTAGDGSSRVFKTAADGKEVVQESRSRNGKTETWTRGEQLPNGNYEWKNDQNPGKTEERSAVTQENGKLSIKYPNDVEYSSSTSGTEKIENTKEGWYKQYTDGRPSEIKYPDGVIRKFTFDGPSDAPKSIEITQKDGTKINVDKISDALYSYKNGKDEQKWNAKYSVSQDGVYKCVDNDAKGKTTTRYPEGLVVVENPADKSRTESKNDQVMKVDRDGKTVEVVRDGSNAITEVRDSANNTAYKKDSNGDFVASAIDATKPIANADEFSRKGVVNFDESGKISFVSNEGTSISQAPGEKAELLASKDKTLAAVLDNSSLSDAEKDRLKQTVLDYTKRTDIEPKDKAVFLESLEKFAKRDDISAKEKNDSYAQLERLLESKSDKAFNAKDRALLAEQLAWHMANPSSNAQGQNPNCQVTVIRGKLLYENPSQFARMMTDVITTGEFVTQDKTVIKVPPASMTVGKGAEESKFPPEDGNRSWLGKISDATCANIHWQRQSVAPNGVVVGKGNLIYKQEAPENRKDSGARVFMVASDGQHYPQSGTDNKILENPTMRSADIANTYSQIVGNSKDVSVVAVYREGVTLGTGVALVGGEEQLHQQLQSGGVKIAQVWTGTDWVEKEPNRIAGITPKEYKPGEHVVLIKDYDPKTRTVAVDNSWSSRFDRLGPNGRIPLHKLYMAMAKQE